MPDPKFQVARKPADHAAVLVVLCDRLEMEDLFDFQAACLDLLETDLPNLTIDARAVKIITSVFIGTVVKTSMQARGTGQQLAISTTPELAKLFRQLLGEEVVEIRAVDA